MGFFVVSLYFLIQKNKLKILLGGQRAPLEGVAPNLHLATNLPISQFCLSLVNFFHIFPILDIVDKSISLSIITIMAHSR